MDKWRLCWILLVVKLISGHLEHDYRNWTLIRQKRFIVWTDGGSTKLAPTVIIPLKFYDKKKWRSLVLTFNFQFQYNMVQQPSDWWDVYSWNIMRSLRGSTLVEKEPVDLTATYLYAFLENFMNNRGKNGRQCMQRAICQNAQAIKGTSVYEQIYHRLLTPEDTMEEHYKTAFEEGLHGVDCFQIYSKCPMGHAIFDQFVQYKYE